MPSNRWSITHYGHYWEGTTLYVFCQTDVDCHMYLHWTDKEMHIHLRSEDTRGVRKLSDPDFCFVQWQVIEQNEAGDTPYHSFDFPNWQECLRRWWLFVATIATLETPSTSCIFTAHGFIQGDAFNMRHTDLTHKEEAGVIDHANSSVTGAKLKYPFTFLSFPFTPTAAPTANYEAANKKYVDDSIPLETWSFLKAQEVHLFSDFSGWLEATAGSGATSRERTRAEGRSGTTIASLACIYTDIYTTFSGDAPSTNLNWDKAIEIIFFGAWPAAGIAVAREAWMRLSADITAGDLATNGVGFRFRRDGLILYSQTMTPGGLESKTISSGVAWHHQIHAFRIVHTPGVDVKFYIDDVLKTTHTVHVPAGNLAGTGRISVGAANPTEAEDQRVFVNRIILKKAFN